MDIWSMTRPALENWFSSRGENPAKAAILLERLYQRGLRVFSELPFAQRVISALSEEFTMELPETVARSGDDSTEKLLLEYPDGSLVESVLMRQTYGGSVCVSTQVGCAMGLRVLPERTAQEAPQPHRRGDNGSGDENPPGVLRGYPQRDGHGDRRAIR